jgi:hypothetical protein
MEGVAKVSPSQYQPQSVPFTTNKKLKQINFIFVLQQHLIPHISPSKSMDFQTLTPVRAYAALPNQERAADREGEVRLGRVPSAQLAPNTSHRVPCICVQRYGSWSWEPVETISGARWTQIRENVSRSLETTFNLIKPAKIEHLKKEMKIKDEAIAILKDLYAKLSREEKLAMLTRHKKTFMGRHTCRGCLVLTDKLTFCIHADCTGLCTACAEKNNDTCLACGQKQEQKCPICKDKKSTTDLMRNPTDACRHSVCYKCYAMAFQSGHPIWNCPLCRCEFTKSRSRNHSARHIHFDSESEGDLSGDESEWEDPADFDNIHTNITPAAATHAPATPPPATPPTAAALPALALPALAAAPLSPSTPIALARPIGTHPANN